MPNTSNQEQETGSPRRIYFDDEADRILDIHASALGPRTRSMVVCALLRALAGVQPRRGEEKVVEQLKRVFGREHFLSFLRAVDSAMPANTQPITCEKGAGCPEAWVLPSGVGVLAFFHPSEANVGDIFTKASKLTADYSLSRVIVATTNGHSLDGTHRQMLAAAGVELVALADLREELAKLKAKKSKR